MNNVLDHKCPNCNAVLKYDPHLEKWKCEYCRGEFTLNELDIIKKENNIEYSKKGNSENYGYICKNCGAQIIASENTSSTSCVYCKNTAIIMDKLTGEFNPDYVIPFKTKKVDAINAFKKFCKGKILMPKEFNNKKNIDEITGIYIPFWLYNFDADGIIEADCKRITTFRSGNYMYTKTDTYLATRGGSMTFNYVPVDGSKRFSNDIMNSIEPFDYSNLKEFNYSYLSGFLSEKYDVDKITASKDAIARAKNSFIDEMSKDIVGFNTVVPINNSINLSDKGSFYVLLPVWILNIKYKDKIYTFAMNGETGKLIGNIPIDKKKAVIIFALVFALTFIFLLIISYLR